MKKICTLLFLGFLINVSSASDLEWKTYTSLFKINDLCFKNDFFWCATEGGIFALNPYTQEVRNWNRQDGLAYNLATSVISDTGDIIWIGFDNGLIQKFNVETYEFHTFFDYQGTSITCMISAGDSLFVGLDIGLSLFIKSRQEVKETYKQLGYDLQVELPVSDIAISENTIWAGTEQGLAYAQLKNINLLDPANWNNVFAEDGLPSSFITSLLQYDTTIYVGTDSLLSRKAGNDWENVHTDQYFDSSGVRDLVSINSELYILAGNGVYKLTDDVLNRISSGFSNGISLACTADELVVGTDRGLKYMFSDQQYWKSFVPNSPQSNRFEDVTMDKQGNLWCAVMGGFCCFDGETWTVYDKTNLKELRPRKTQDMRSVVVDDSHNVWFGSWGGGIILLKSDSTFNFFNAENNYLGGISEDSLYAVVPDMLVDHNGAVWLLNYRSDNGKYLISVVTDSLTGEFIWTYYTTPTQNPFPNCIAEDSYGQKWIGTDKSGVYVINDNNTPTISNDDYFAGTLTTADGLESEEITSLAANAYGGMFIGTTVGIYEYPGGYYLNYDNYIQCLFIDGFNNLWAGMDQGLSFFPEGSYSGDDYNVDNSDLTSNDVRCFTLDNKTGNLYIGTSQGLTCIKTPYAEPGTTLDNLVAYPNPFIVEKHHSVTIDNLTLNTAVKIYSPSGYLIKSYSREEVKGKMITWDGKNESGDYIASGVYIIVAGIEEGEAKVGKLAVIH